MRTSRAPPALSRRHHDQPALLMLIVAVLLATVLLRFTLVAALTYVLLPRAPACPRCAATLTQIRNTFLRRLVPLLEHRWCLECGWHGVVRRAAGGGRREGTLNRA